MGMDDKLSWKNVRAERYRGRLTFKGRQRKREEKGKLRRSREERMSRKTKKSREDFRDSLSTFKIKL